uniref:Chitin-binding type-2 domain-containing protein n=1 Tax=Panagrellus redivivus TaxID=6233 RepID=A0A7E4ULE9_PANRE
MRIRLKPLLVIALAVVALAVAASDSQRLADSLCVGKKDGHYALGICSSDYLTCSNGKSFAHRCKFGLFFDKANEQCADRKAIADCQAPFDCSDRDDGIYSDGCSRNFWYCFGGSAASASCQSGLYFNTETNTCEYFKSIKACKGKCNQKAPVGDTCSDHYFVCIDQVPTRQTCKKHEAYDDYYRKCRSLTELPQCVLHQIHREQNTDGDNDEFHPRRLDNPGQNVPDSSSDTLQDDPLHATYPTYTPPTTTAAYAVEGSGEEVDIELGGIRRMSRFDFDDSDQILAAVMRSSGGDLHSRVNVPGKLTRVGDLPDLGQLPSIQKAGSVESMIPTFCLDRPDGNFFISCGAKFINCVNHVATVMSCPNGLVFSEDLNVCGFVNDVPACANGALKADVPVVSAPINDNDMSVERLASNPSKPGRQLDSICVKDRDSSPLFGLSSCSPYFIACKNGAAIVASCDEHFLFNEDTLRCETPYETFCPEKLPADAEQICETVGNVPFIDTPLIKAACSEHSVRVFEECADSYYVCHEQAFLRRDCPDGLSFDSVVGACVSHCGDSRHVKKLVGSSYEEFCKQQGPGKHGLGCTSVYVDCSSNGVSSVIECEDGLVFNKFIQGCALYCEGTPVSQLDDLTSPMVFEPKADSQRTDGKNDDHKPFEDFRASNTVDSVDYRNVDPDAVCAKHSDGLYSLGCGDAYFSCYNGHGVLIHCEDGLVFNSDSGTCTDRCARGSSSEGVPKKASLCPAGVTGYQSTSQCSDAFVYCVNGVEYKQACPAGRYFNVYLRACDLSCDAPTESGARDDDGLVKDGPASNPTTKAPPSFRDIRLFRQQAPSTFLTDGFSQNPVYIPRAPRPLQIDQFAGIPEALPVRVPFTPNNIPGHVGFDAFNRGNFPEKPRVVHSPFPRFSDVRPINPALNPNPLPAVGVPPLQPRLRSVNILPPVTPRPAPVKPLPIISESAEVLDVLNGNDTSHANDSAEVPTEDASFEGSGISAEEDIEPETTSLWRKKREITTQCQYKQRWYNPNIAFIETYDFVPQVDCAAGKTPLGCTSGYIECVNGVPQVYSCADDFIYDKQTSRCIFNHNARCTLGLTVLDSKLPRRHPGASASLRHVSGTAVEEQTSDPRCKFGAQGSVPLGFCLSEFLLCLPNGQATTSYCLNSELFDHASGKCVRAAECGLHARGFHSISAPSPASTSRLVGPANLQCLGREDGDSLPTGKCLSTFIRCQKGEPVRSYCPKAGDSFSTHLKSCVSKAQLPECRPSTSITLDLSSSDASNPCVDQPDGFYRHPESCQRIIQCYGRETFEQQPCQHDLAFDAARGVCDYRRNVPGCENAVDSTARAEAGGNETIANTACDEGSHGAYVPNKSDCSSYFRCVWGRYEAMQCPEGTVFNTNLSVCDWPDQVPHCAAT